MNKSAHHNVVSVTPGKTLFRMSRPLLLMRLIPTLLCIVLLACTAGLQGSNSSAPPSASDAPSVSGQCLDWIVLTVGENSVTWLEYLYWYGIRYGWNPKEAFRAYLRETDSWKEFVRFETTVVALREMGMIPPTEESFERVFESVRSDFPASINEAILRRVLRKVIWVSTYRDETFRYSITIRPERIDRRFEEMRKTNPNLDLIEVYDEIYRELVKEALPEAFRSWQEAEVRKRKTLRYDFPSFCQFKPES